MAGRSGPYRAHISWAAARPGPSNFDKMGRGPTQPITSSNFHGPARPIKFSKVSARPSPSHFQKSRPGPARPRQTAHDKPCNFLPSEREREILSPVFCTAAPKCVCIRRLAGARHLYITDRFVNNVTRGWWVRAPNERAPFRFHRAVVGFVHRCLLRTRNLTASNEHLAEFFSGMILAQVLSRNYFFRGF